MNLSKESIEEFIEIHRIEFGETLSYEKAEEEAKELLSLYSIILPLNTKKHENEQ